MTNFEQVADEARAFIHAEMKANTRHDKIVLDLCEMYGMEWNFADRLAIDVALEESHQEALSAWMLVTLAVLVPLLLAVLTLLGALLLGDTFRERALLLALLIGGSGLGLALIALVLYSTYQNANKERYRCPHCGYLANSQGSEASLFLPQYKAFTYHIHEQNAGTSHGPEQRAPAQIYGRQGTAVGRDTYRHIEVQEICRHCKQVARTRKRRVKVSSAPRPRENDWD